MNRSVIVAGIAGFVLGVFLMLVWPAGTGSGQGQGREDPGGGIRSQPGPQSTARSGGAKSGTRVGARDEARTDEQLVADLRDSFLTSNPISRKLKAAKVFSQMTPENAPLMRELFLDFDRQGIHFDAEWELMWRQWGTVDAVSALESLQREREAGFGGYFQRITEVIFNGWSEVEPLEAKLRLEQIDDPDQFRSAFAGLLGGADLLEIDGMAKSMDYRESGLAGKAAEVVAERVLREAGNTDALETWYEGIENPELKRGALDHVYWRLKKKDLDLAAEWVHERSVEGVDTNRIVREIVRDYARGDVIDGLDWFLDLPSEVRVQSDLGLLLSIAQARGEKFEDWSAANGEKLEAAREEIGQR